jgi:hypothetical protein
VKPDATSTAPRSQRIAPGRVEAKALVQPAVTTGGALSFRFEQRHLGLLAAGALVLGGAWFATSSAEARIRREEQLIYSGTEIRDAIAAYYFAAPPGKRELPRDMHDLVDDTRDGTHRRHLSRMVKDPVTGSDDWVIVWTPDHRMAGVHSASEDAPVGRHDFDRDAVDVAGARHYSQWVFRFDPGPFLPADEARRAPVDTGGHGRVDAPRRRPHDDAAVAPRLPTSAVLSPPAHRSRHGRAAAAARHVPAGAVSRVASRGGDPGQDRPYRDSRLVPSPDVGGLVAWDAPPIGVPTTEVPAAQVRGPAGGRARARENDRGAATDAATASAPWPIDGPSRPGASPAALPAPEAAVARRGGPTALGVAAVPPPGSAAAGASHRADAPIALKWAIPEWLLPAKLEPYGSPAVARADQAASVSGRSAPSSEDRAAAADARGPSAAPTAPQFIGTAMRAREAIAEPAAGDPLQGARAMGTLTGEPDAPGAPATPQGTPGAEPSRGPDGASAEPARAARPARGRYQARAVATGAAAGAMPAAVQMPSVPGSSMALPSPAEPPAAASDGVPTPEELAQARQVACDMMAASDREVCARPADDGTGAEPTDCLRTAEDRFERCLRGDPSAGVAAQ